MTSLLFTHKCKVGEHNVEEEEEEEEHGEEEEEKGKPRTRPNFRGLWKVLEANHLLSFDLSKQNDTSCVGTLLRSGVMLAFIIDIAHTCNIYNLSTFTISTAKIQLLFVIQCNDNQWEFVPCPCGADSMAATEPTVPQNPKKQGTHGATWGLGGGARGIELSPLTTLPPSLSLSHFPWTHNIWIYSLLPFRCFALYMEWRNHHSFSLSLEPNSLQNCENQTHVLIYHQALYTDAYSLQKESWTWGV